MKKASVKRLYRTAIHESGHAVMAFEKGMKNRGVTIIPDSEFLGSCKTVNLFYRVDVDIVGCLDPKYPKHFYNALRSAMFSFAGAMSEWEYLGTKGITGYNYDHREAVKILDRFTGSDEQLRTLIKYVRVCTLDFMKSPHTRKLIFALADVLVERRKLTGREVKEILWAAALRGM